MILPGNIFLPWESAVARRIIEESCETAYHRCSMQILISRDEEWKVRCVSGLKFLEAIRPGQLEDPESSG